MNFKLRPLTQTDIDSLAKYANNKKIADNLTNKFPHPYTKEHAASFIKFAKSHKPNHIQAIEVASELIGAIGIHPQEDVFCKNAEMGYWLAEPFWGKGIISKAIALMINYGFDHFEIERIFARPFGTNIASQRVLMKNGFVLEATFKNTIFKNGVYHDELVYAVRKAGYC